MDHIWQRWCVRLSRANMDARTLPLLLIRLPGGMAERLKAHAWKACVRESVPWVRIPLPPPQLDAAPYNPPPGSAAQLAAAHERRLPSLAILFKRGECSRTGTFPAIRRSECCSVSLAERTGKAGGTAHRQTPAPVLRLRSDAVRSGRWRQATHCAAFQALALGQPNHALSPLPRR